MCQLKRNRLKLWETTALFTALANPISSSETYEKECGYQIYRRVELYDNRTILPKGWEGIKRLIKMRRWGTRNNIPFDEVSYYLLSKPINSAAKVGKMIRGHWTIENNLHWAKDVNMGEDNMSIKKPKTATLLAYLNNVSVNILAKSGLKPKKDTFAKISNKVNELIKLFI